MESSTEIDSVFRSILLKRVAQWALWGMCAGISILFLLLFYQLYTHLKPLSAKLLWDVVVVAGCGAYVGGFLGAVFGYLSIAFPYGWARSDDERLRVLLKAEGHDDGDLE